MNFNEVMNFLNEVAIQNPKAISLASGRPTPISFDRTNFDEYTKIFINYCIKISDVDATTIKNKLFEYGPAQGIANNLLCRYIEKDLNIRSTSQSILICNGFQEGLLLLLIHYLVEEEDCVLTFDPSYIGLTGLVKSLKKEVVPIEYRLLDECFEKGLENRILKILKRGKKPKLFYVNPDYNNPLSNTFSLDQRLLLINLCNKYDIKIIEDTPYRYFSFSNKPPPTLKELDDKSTVVHIGTFSKTLYPSLRIGYVICPEIDTSLINSLVSLKSFVSVNSSAVIQAILAGCLIKNDFSLKERLLPIINQYLSQRNALVKAFEEELSDIEGISWNVPDGGFFMVMSLPFEVSNKDVVNCAKKYNVIFMPVDYFVLDSDQYKNMIRLAFSYYDEEKTFLGGKNLSRFIKDRIRQCLEKKS